MATKEDKKLDSKPTKVKLEKKSKGDSKAITEVGAKARYIRIAPRKVRLVIDQLRGLEVEEALEILKFINKISVKPITKLINSAVANAENNFEMEKKDLYIKKIIANDGPIVKRWKPRAYGRSAMIRKRTSHIELILGIKKGAKAGKKSVKTKDLTAKAEDVKVVKPQDVKKDAPKVSGKGPEEKGQDSKGFLKGMFRRKTG